MKGNDKYPFILPQRILHILMVQSYNLPKLGLLSGKMGILLFFLEYGEKTGQSVLKDYAFDIYEKIMTEVNEKMDIGLEVGLSGVGWGIEYMLQNKYAEGNSSEICEEIDKQIMKIDPRRITDLSLERGLEGLLHYVLIHIQGSMRSTTPCPFDSRYLEDLYVAVSAILPKKMNKEISNLIEIYKKYYFNKENISYSIDLQIFIDKIQLDVNHITTYPLGLKNGLAGYMFNNYISI